MAARKHDTTRPIPALNLGNERVDRFLESIRRERVPSLLFAGPEGAGKEYTAIEFCRRLCCQEPTPCKLPEPGRPVDEPDARLCESCMQAVVLENPGIHFVYPTPTQGTGEPDDGDVTDIARVLDEKRRDIFARYYFKKKASIRIARARAIIQRASTKPFGAPYNIFLILDAHEMREAAQNALLKVVEEPPPHAILIFVTNNPDSILYTIRSRCQQVRFAPLKSEAVAGVLQGYYGLDGDTARRVAALSQGSIQRARALIDSLDDTDRRAGAAFAAGLLEAPESWVVGQALSVGQGSNRDAVARYLHELSIVFRDAMAGEESLFVNRDDTAGIKRLVSAWDRKRLPAVIDRIARARYEILVRNLNIDAAMVDLFLDLRRAALQGVDARRR